MFNPIKMAHRMTASFLGEDGLSKGLFYTFYLYLYFDALILVLYFWFARDIDYLKKAVEK